MQLGSHKTKYYKGLPIEKSLQEIRRVLRDNNRLILQAPSGSGKSSIVPLVLLEEDWLEDQKIWLLQPRRVAAKSLAARMSQLLGSKLGETVGYRIRFEAAITDATRVEVLTEGILTRMIQGDPTLEGIKAIIFDEFHERSLHLDLALALALEVQESIRPDLRIIIMSATLDSVAISNALKAQIVEGSGVPHPVEIKYLKQQPTEKLSLLAAKETAEILKTSPGDTLVFLPGVSEIKSCRAALEARLGSTGISIFELYGDQSSEAQEMALRALPEKRKIILATPIAETSLTIEGVRIVVDSGVAKYSRYDSALGLNRLITERISKDSADQRAGRAGRLGPGICLRLWTEHEQSNMRPCRTPEIMVSDLSSFALELAAWGKEPKADIFLIDHPKPEDWEQAYNLLEQLGALEIRAVEIGAVEGGGKITETGKKMSELSIHPRLGRMLVEAQAISEIDLACDILAILEERDMFERGTEVGADIDIRLQTLDNFRKHWSVAPAKTSQVARIDKVSKEWKKRLRGGTSIGKASAGLLLGLAYPERIAKRRIESNKYLTVSGTGVELSRNDNLIKSEYLAVANLHMSSANAKVFLAAEISREEIQIAFSGSIVTESTLELENSNGRIRAQELKRLGAMILESRDIEPDRKQAKEFLFRELQSRGGIEYLHWNEQDRQLYNRIQQFRRLFPELLDVAESPIGLKEVTDLEQLIRSKLDSPKSLEELRRFELGKALYSVMSFKQKKVLDTELPAGICTPDGRERRIDYSSSENPVLACMLQDLFGWKQTPTLASGRIKLTLHILSPAQRPLQITQDLSGFWKNTYPEVRKELRGRYPKHQWPEDPEKAVIGQRLKR